ncbi:MAG: hypothetical protein KKF79_04850, partial [Gammaproteobacteria bacterium]|nr:hypothetical protein [Gammaproteobacteria bacterium]
FSGPALVAAIVANGDEANSSANPAAANLLQTPTELMPASATPLGLLELVIPAELVLALDALFAGRKISPLAEVL